jgi:hypothetical protein
MAAWDGVRFVDIRHRDQAAVQRVSCPRQKTPEELGIAIPFIEVGEALCARIALCDDSFVVRVESQQEHACGRPRDDLRTRYTHSVGQKNMCVTAAPTVPDGSNAAADAAPTVTAPAVTVKPTAARK